MARGDMKRAREEIADAQEMLGRLVTDYTASPVKQRAVMKMRNGQMGREAFLDDARSHACMYYKISDTMLDETLVLFEQYIFGYSYLTPFIDDPEVSDIHCVAWDKIRIKKKGVRMDAGISFRDEKEYRQFVDMVATKNNVSLSNVTALQRFTDSVTSDAAILRFTVSMPIVNSVDSVYLSIRKVPKDFPLMDDLVREGMMDDEMAALLADRFRSGSILICGGNSAGKTTLLNALKETISHGSRVMVVQQSDELTTKSHPDMVFLHSIPGSGESHVNYELDAIAVAGLTMDVDYFIVGEIKGPESSHLLKGAYSGQICAGTVHAPGADAAFDKVVDYALSAPGNAYTKADMMKMLCSSFSTVVFMKGYRVAQVLGIEGWDAVSGSARYSTIFDLSEGGWA